MNFYATNLCALFTPAPEHQILLSELFDFLDKKSTYSTIRAKC